MKPGLKADPMLYEDGMTVLRCWSCAGIGSVSDRRCWKCDGTGSVFWVGGAAYPYTPEGEKRAKSVIRPEPDSF